MLSIDGIFVIAGIAGRPVIALSPVVLIGFTPVSVLVGKVIGGIPVGKLVDIVPVASILKRSNSNRKRVDGMAECERREKRKE